MVEAYDNHTYKIDRQWQSSVQSETRLKLYRPCMAESGKAPASLESRRRPNMRGALRTKSKEAASKEAEITLDLPPIPEPDPIDTPETEEPEVETPVEANTRIEIPVATPEPDSAEAPAGNAGADTCCPA